MATPESTAAFIEFTLTREEAHQLLRAINFAREHVVGLSQLTRRFQAKTDAFRYSQLRDRLLEAIARREIPIDFDDLN
ncbi:MAG: hypothetical protein JWO36_5738 [Myxococcales bacterium]|nr:hypothetical protein [Myxococcales bacterium]